jgi:hypothetical protein
MHAVPLHIPQPINCHTTASDNTTYIIVCTIIQFSSYLFTCKLNRLRANYKVSTSKEKRNTHKHNTKTRQYYHNNLPQKNISQLSSYIFRILQPNNTSISLWLLNTSKRHRINLSTYSGPFATVIRMSSPPPTLINNQEILGRNNRILSLIRHGPH